MMLHRAGSAILLCLGLAAIAAMVGFGFLRATSRLDMSSDSEMLHGLARDAAQSGLAHATEQILNDYNAATLDLAYFNSVSPSPQSATVSAAPTHLDGPYRAPFVALNIPNKLKHTQSVSTLGYDDVQEENHLLLPFVNKSAGDSANNDWHYDFGMMICDGRGRYIEPGYHNVTRPNPATANPEPVAAVRFTDLAAAAPERSSGLFLDRDLHRMSGGTATEQREKARYRVRYAIGVEDLQGHLLSNPRAAMNVDWQDANNDYRVIPPWLNTAAYTWNTMIASCSFGALPTVPLRMDHVFRGRGSATNADRAWAGSRPGLPASFPMMFRAAGFASDPFTGKIIPDPVVYNQFWGNHTIDGATASALYYDSDPSNKENMGGRLYRFVNTSAARWENIAMNPAGGEILTPVNTTTHYAHAHLGPQVSWYNQFFAVQGYLSSRSGFSIYNDSGIDNVDKPSATDGWNASDLGGVPWKGKSSHYLTVPTPFGRRMEKPAGGLPVLASRKWYEGVVDTPWLVNALTAAPQTTSMMIIAYLPPYLKTLRYNQDEYYRKTGESLVTDAAGRTSLVETYSNTVDHTVAGPWFVSLRGLEIINDQLGSGFCDFPAPSSIDGGYTIKPDYFQADPEPRPVEQRYPGPLARGDSATVDQGSDDLGEHIDADTRGIGRCTHTGQPLLYLGGADQERYETDGVLETAQTWNRKWRIIRRIDSALYKFKNSYFWDLAYALTQALSFARASWVQYPNYVFDPRTYIAPADLRDFRNYDSVEELDRLFLRQLGENFDAPGTPCADNPIRQLYMSHHPSAWEQNVIKYQVESTPAANTIASLKALGLLATTSGVKSEERAKVMERMLNDFRLSFFGVSPRYSDDFRPLDFDGDTHVHCSCYDINSAATANEVKYKTARWKTAGASGRGPAPTDLTTEGVDYTQGFTRNPWFCATGCFFIGKSRYYRIFARGEVYDNLLNKPIAAQTVESVLAVDPDGPLMGPGPAAGNQTLFQRWHYNDQTSELPLNLR